MKRSDLLRSPIVRLTFVGAVLGTPLVARQSPDALSQYFEGKQVTVKMDMPGSQKGVDVYPGRPQPLDTKGYQDRLKAYGVSLRNGDQVMITKIKVKSDNIEFQLGGGGFGTAGDNTDTSVHFKPAEKSAHEKELEDQLSKETDEDRRRSLSRELDDVRRDRERQDRRNQRMAEDDATNRKEQVLEKRVQGGSRFNIRIENKSAESITPEFVMSTLTPYVEFGTSSRPATMNSSSVPATAAPAGGGAANGVQGLKKGLTRAQVDALFGPAVESHDRTEGTLTTTTCTYETPNQRAPNSFHAYLPYLTGSVGCCGGER
jgi:hypothetical protein